MLKFKTCNFIYEGRDLTITGNNINISITLYLENDIDLFDMFALFYAQEFECEHCNINGNEYDNLTIKMEKVNNKVNMYFTKDGKAIYSILDA